MVRTKSRMGSEVLASQLFVSGRGLCIGPVLLTACCSPDYEVNELPSHAD